MNKKQCLAQKSKEYYNKLLERKKQLDEEIPILYDKHKALETERNCIEQKIEESELRFLFWMAEPSSDFEHNSFLKTIKAYDSADAIKKYYLAIKDMKDLENREAFAFFEVGGENTKISYLFYDKKLKVLYH